MGKPSSEWFEREQYVKQLDDILRAFSEGKPTKNVVVTGQPKSGKNTLISHALARHKDIFSVPLDLRRISLSPESFAVESVAAICFWYLKAPRTEYPKFQNISFLQTLEKKLESASFAVIQKVHNELLKIKPDQRQLISLVFEFIAQISRQKKMIIAIEHAQHLLELNNFPQIKDITKICRFSQKHALFIFESTSATVLKKSFPDFNFIELSYFSSEETKKFLARHDITDEKTVERIYTLSGGNPYVLATIAQASSKTALEKHLLEHFVSKNSALYHYGELAYREALAKTSGQTLIKILLKVIAHEEGLRLSEIAKRIYRSAPVTKALLERLIASDILCKKNNRYYFNDQTLRHWLKLTNLGYSFEHQPTEQDLDEVRQLL